MSLSTEQKSKIISLLSNKLEEKLEKYGRETTSMPFLARLIQDNEKIAAYSFIHSIATTLGASIYEEISVIIASETSQECFKRYNVGGSISKEQKIVINKIITELRNGSRKADIYREIDEILKIHNKKSEREKEYQKSGNQADFYMKRKEEEFFFEIKTVKPNIDVFEKSKTKLLEWVARKGKKIHPILAFPYNPYHPKPYLRFTEVGMMDPPHDFLIGEQYWDFLGGADTFNELLQIFNDVGNQYKERLEQKFKEVAEKKIDSY